MSDYSDQAGLYAQGVTGPARRPSPYGAPGTRLHRSIALHDDVMLNRRDAYYAEGGLAPWERDDTARFGPSEPPVGTVLRWRKEGSPRADEALAVAHRTGSGWYVIERDDHYTWSQVAKMIGERECHVAVAWREIPRPEPTPAGDDAVKDWASQFLPVTEHEVTDAGTEEQS